MWQWVVCLLSCTLLPSSALLLVGACVGVEVGAGVGIQVLCRMVTIIGRNSVTTAAILLVAAMCP